MTATRKISYTVPCASAFRDAVNALAAARGMNAGDLARSILLTLPAAAIDAAPDPGEPGPGDRETVILKSGPAAGRPWRRKPRLQVRMARGSTPLRIRRALGLALGIEAGRYVLALSDRDAPPPPPDPETTKAERRADALAEENERLRTVVSVLAFDPLPGGVRSRTEALYVMGFPGDAEPSARAIRARFRMLATIHHPDSPYGSNERMAQLNEAVSLLRSDH